MRSRIEGVNMNTWLRRYDELMRRGGGVGIAMAILMSLLVAGNAGGDVTEDLPVQVSEIPKILFLVERNTSMTTEWYNVAGHPTRFEVVQDAIIAAVNSAPTEMEFAVVGTSNPANHWKRVSSFDHSNTHLQDAVDNESASISSNYIASTYAWVVNQYLSETDTALSEWDRAPFRESCSAIDVIVIGDSIGGTEDNDVFNYPDTMYDTFTGDVYLTIQPENENDRTLLDDVAFYAVNNDLTAAQAGAQTVRTHSILLDADTVNDTTTEELFESAATAGGGIYTRAVHPDDVAVGISMAITDKIRSLTGISTSFTSASGHRLFRGWTEIWGFTDDTRGVPLHRGHIEAFQIINDPSDANYGVIRDTELWDAGTILASRKAVHSGSNSQEYSDTDPAAYTRTLWTNDDQGGVYTPQTLVAFDSTNAVDIGGLLFDDYGTDYETSPPTVDETCDTTTGPFPFNDYDRDCDVDSTDAQEVIDFLRGVDTSTYGVGEDVMPDISEVGTDLPAKGPWKLGGMFLSQPAFADAEPSIVTDDPAFYSFLNRIDDLDPVLYVAANDGFLHAFKVPFLDSDEDGWEDATADTAGGWELWGYIPRHLLDHASDYHDDMHRAINLMMDGELYLNDGSVNLTYVWMDGRANYVDADCTTATTDGIPDSDGCEYHRVLVVSMGMGSRYHYALDVSHPWYPKFLWEWVGDASGWRKGMSAGTPVFGEVLDLNSTEYYTPVVFWSSGPTDNDAVPSSARRAGRRWYMVKLLDPSDTTPFSSTGYRITSSVAPTYVTASATDPRYYIDDAASGLFSTPAAIDYDDDGLTDALYIGDRHGYLFKTLIDNGDLDRGTIEDVTGIDAHTCMFGEPFATPTRSDAQAENHAVYFRPSVSRDNSGRVRVAWGTGWPGNLFEPYDNGYMWFLEDEDGPDGCSAGVESDCGTNYNPLVLGAGEKLVGPVLTYGGIVLFATYITDNATLGAACGVGHARIYALGLDDCGGAYESGQDWGPESLSVTDSEYIEIEGIPSRFSYSNDGVYITVTAADGTIESYGPIRPTPTATAGDKVFFSNWRNVY